MRSVTALRILCGYVAVYHLGLGAVAILAPAETMAKVIQFFYGTALPVDGTLFYVAKLLGAYFIAFGGMMGMVAARPLKFIQLTWVAVVFFAIRLVELLYFRGLITAEFQIPDARIFEKIAVIVVLGVALAVLSIKVQKQQLPQAA